MLMTGLRLSANVAFISAVGVEMVASRNGLGASLWLSWQLFRIEQLYATLVVIALVGMALAAVIRRAGRHVAPWTAEEPVRAPW